MFGYPRDTCTDVAAAAGSAAAVGVGGCTCKTGARDELCTMPGMYTDCGIDIDF